MKGETGRGARFIPVKVARQCAQVETAGVRCAVTVPLVRVLPTPLSSPWAGDSYKAPKLQRKVTQTNTAGGKEK